MIVFIVKILLLLMHLRLEENLPQFFFRKKISGIDSEIIFKMAASMGSMQK